MEAIRESNENEQFKAFPILISFLIGGFIGLFSETALNIALSNLIQIFNITSAKAQWLTTGYLLTLGTLAPISGFLIQWFTTRKLFIVSLSFSIIGTLIAALAPNFEVLLLARVIQAIGSGILLPLMINTILIIFPLNKRGAAMGIVGLVIMFAPAISPTIAGLLIEKLNWHWIFWLSLPFLLIALAGGILFVQNVTTITKPKIDIVSILLSTLGFGGIVFGFSSAGSDGWSNMIVIISLVTGIVALLLFGVRQLSLEQPMINLKTFKYPMFVIGILMVFICMMIILSSMLLLPLYLQIGLGLSAFATGLILLPGGILNGIISPISGRLFDKYGPKYLVISGFIIIIVVLLFFSKITTTSSEGIIILLHTFLMIGIAMVLMPAQTNGLNQLPRQFYPDGTAIVNTLQQVAGAIGTAIAVTIMSNGQQNYLKRAKDPSDSSVLSDALTAGVQNAFIFAAVIAIIGLIIAFFIKFVKTEH
ncbi:DHA2 family efflux MFS transporter permease subunit [Lysinibacillus sp. NPDC092081]|uniref:DHA2 family efflux MFS transporter permease subunit n=1 Tax=Lysinibacillus sp. NPDC092081 TaxID=3364131 RepID=UPI003803A768